MSKHGPLHIAPRALSRPDRSPRAREVARRLAILRWRTTILSADGAFLLVAGVTALVADLAGYFFGAGPFAALAGQPLALGAVEAHGLAALLGLLLMRITARDHWRWHVVALGVHLFFGVCNLLFWEVYALMGATTAGVMSTMAHALLFAVQLACLALGDAGESAELPAWVRSVRGAGFYVRSVASGTLLLGAGAHIAVIVLGREAQPRILTPGLELLLTVPMFYVSVAGWLAWRTFIFRGRWHKVALGLILIYFPIGLPFHLITITTGSTAHYAAFPEWYSLLIVPVMVVIMACFAGLRLRTNRS